MPVAVAFANTDQRFFKGLRGKQRDRMIAMVRNFGGRRSGRSGQERLN